jgi:hypothetical protein
MGKSPDHPPVRPFVQPPGHSVAQNAARQAPTPGTKILAATLAGDYQHRPPAGAPRPVQEGAQGPMCLGLGQAMQIEGGLYVHLPAPHSGFGALF